MMTDAALARRALEHGWLSEREALSLFGAATIDAAFRAARPPHRRRGWWIPIADVPLHLANGWRLIDDGGAGGDALLAPPEHWGAS